MARYKNANWRLDDPVTNWEQVYTAVLMDIRDELQTLVKIFQCPNFQQIPFKLDKITVNTRKVKRRRAK